MEEEALSSFNGLSLISPSPSEAQLVALPTGLEDTLQLTWSAPPNQELSDTLRFLQNEISDLRNKILNLECEARISSQKISTLQDDARISSQKTSKLEDGVLHINSQVIPLADAVHLRCMLDTWIHENGFGPGSGSRTSWLRGDKTRLSKISRIPEPDLEDFFEYVVSLYL